MNITYHHQFNRCVSRKTASQDLYTTGLEGCLPTSNLPKQIINSGFFLYVYSLCSISLSFERHFFLYDKTIIDKL